MKIKILKSKDGSFEGESGLVEYYFYQAENEKGEVIQFGSKYIYDVGAEVNIALEKTERKIVNKKTGEEKTVFGYKESSF